jgi:hypothetical protein
MGLMDKIKEAATEGAEAAKKGMSAAKDRVDDVQARHKADELAKQLGYLVVRERSQGSTGDEADRLVSEIVKIEESLAASGGDAPSEGSETAG